jgi:DNA adenine methylase
MKSLKSPLRYPGGKSRALAQIREQVPPQFDAFREPFIGGGSVYLAIRSWFPDLGGGYWINDFNPDVFHFWAAVRDELPRLIVAIWDYKARFPEGRALYAHLRDESNMSSDFERAVRFFIMNRITFSGVMDAGGYSEQAFRTRFTDSSIGRLENLAGALAETHITNQDYESVVMAPAAPGEEVFIFLDPPYLSVTESKLYGNKGELHTGFEHGRFAEVMRACPHQWLITYDDSPEVRALFDFPGVLLVEWSLQYGMNNYKQARAAVGRELFLRNY